MATYSDRSQALLRDLAQLPPAHRGKARPAPHRPNLFSSAMRQSAPRRGLIDRLVAGEFQAPLILLLGAALLVVAIIVVLS